MHVVLLLLAAAFGATGDPAWTWPVPAPHAVVRGFAAPPTPYAAGHRGIDVDPPGSEVRAPADGVVAFAGTVVDRGVVAIDHAGGVRSSFEPLDPAVHAGEVVHRGEVIGRLGGGGSHRAGVLHIGARIRSGGAWVYVSPLLFLGGVRRAVLLPLEAFP